MSDWRESANRRRDIRQQKPADDSTKPAAAKKDTKRWCRGKVGVEHKPACTPYRTDTPPTNSVWSSSHRWRLLVCETCGRRLDFWYPIGKEQKNNKPAWVDK